MHHLPSTKPLHQNSDDMPSDGLPETALLDAVANLLKEQGFAIDKVRLQSSKIGRAHV